MITTPKMSVDSTKSSSRTGFIVRLIGMLALFGGLIAYAVLLRQMRAGAAGSGGTFGSATPLVAAAAVANVGAAILMVGLAALRDRVTLRIAGIVLAVLLIMLDMPALDALTGPATAKVIALVIGALFLVLPWFFPRGRGGEGTGEGDGQ